MEMNYHLSPEQLWNRLVAMVSAEAKDLYPDLGTFKRKYAESKLSKKCRDAKEAFERALREWQDDQIREFLCNWMFEPPLSLEVQGYSPEKRQQTLDEVYKYIFEQ